MTSRLNHFGLKIILGSMIAIAAIAVTAIALFAHRVEAPGPFLQPRNIIIQPGSSLDSITKTLYRNGVIRQPLLFKLNVRWLDAATQLKAGEYSFAARSSINALVQKLIAGDVLLHAVTIPEGLTTQQVIDRLNADDRLTGSISQPLPEGSLLPETYYIHRGTPRKKLIRRMTTAMTDHLEQAWADRDPDLPFDSPQQALILASIVERETGRSDERQTVAAVFINRLRRNMRLQSDPTVIYAISNGRGTLPRPLSRLDLKTDSPYNTYIIAALPPAPIANPGKSAIDAVLHPDLASPYLYFVADGADGHKFSVTLAQHNKNVRAWRRIRQKQTQQP